MPFAANPGSSSQEVFRIALGGGAGRGAGRVRGTARFTDVDRSLWYDRIDELREHYEAARLCRASRKVGERSTSEGERSNSEGERSMSEDERGKNTGARAS